MEFKMRRAFLFILLSAIVIFTYSYFLFGTIVFYLPILPIILTIIFSIISIILFKINIKLIIGISYFLIFVLSLPIFLFTMLLPPNILMDDFFQYGIIEILFHIIMFIISFSYIITYIFSIIKTIKIKSFSFYSFIPIGHSLLLIIIFYLWFEKMEIMNYK